jgi:hypothetical protein
MGYLVPREAAAGPSRHMTIQLQYAYPESVHIELLHGDLLEGPVRFGDLGLACTNVLWFDLVFRPAITTQLLLRESQIVHASQRRPCS